MAESYTIVDERDEVIGNKTPKEMTKEDVYRVSALWVTNSKGEILIARRSFDKERHPGKWGPAVAGTVEKDETYEANIKKEAREEIGLRDVKFIKGPKIRHDSDYHYFCQWFLLTLDKPAEDFDIERFELEEVRWVTRDYLLRELKHNPEEFLPSMGEWVKLLFHV